MDGRGAFVVRRAVGEENHRSGTARNAPGASGALHPSNRPGGEHGLRLQAVLNGRTQRLSVSRAAGKVRDTRDGVLRLRHIRPVARAGGIHGGERGLRLQTVIGGRTRSLCRASHGRESGTAFYTSGTYVQSPVRAESVAASAACGFRPSLMDGRGAFVVRRAAGKVGRRFIPPAHPSSRPCGRNPWRRARLAASGRL